MSADGDPFLLALEDLEHKLEESAERSAEMKRRIARLRGKREKGLTWREIVDSLEPPLVVQLLTQNIQALNDAGSRVRRAEALALHEDGLTMDEIAERFGVTRQRVSGLLRDARSDPR
jgi:transposase